MPFIFRSDKTVEVDAFTQAYIACALWSTTDNADDSGGSPLDDTYSPEDIAPETLDQMIADCRAFQEAHADDLRFGTPEQAGHDFWLTRERHGAGFWDGDWERSVGERLTNAAHAYGSFDLTVGDDGRIHN